MALRDVILPTLLSGSQSPRATRLRAWLRRAGPGRWLLQRIWRLLIRNYEGRVRDELIAEITPGDVVWDIGANTGEYTEIFASSVGSSGAVVAVEPTPASAQLCRDLIARLGFDNLTIIEAALSETPGKAFLRIDEARLPQQTNCPVIL